MSEHSRFTYRRPIRFHDPPQREHRHRGDRGRTGSGVENFAGSSTGSNQRAGKQRADNSADTADT